MWDKSLVEKQVVDFKPYRIGWIRFLQWSVFAGENARESGAKNSLFKHGPHLTENDVTTSSSEQRVKFNVAAVYGRFKKWNMWDKSLVEKQVVDFKPYRIGWIRFLQWSVFAGENARESGAKNSLFKHGPHLNIYWVYRTLKFIFAWFLLHVGW